MEAGAAGDAPRTFTVALATPCVFCGVQVGAAVTELRCGHVACSLCVAKACMNSATAAACPQCGAEFYYVECREGRRPTAVVGAVTFEATPCALTLAPLTKRIDDAALAAARTITTFFSKAHRATRVLVTVSRMLDGKVNAVTGDIEAAGMARQLGAELRQRIIEAAGRRGRGVRSDVALVESLDALAELASAAAETAATALCEGLVGGPRKDLDATTKVRAKALHDLLLKVNTPNISTDTGRFLASLCETLNTSYKLRDVLSKLGLSMSRAAVLLELVERPEGLGDITKRLSRPTAPAAAPSTARPLRRP